MSDNPGDWRIERIAKRHIRTSFDSGEPDLNAYLKEYAGQNTRRRLGTTYVAVRGEDPRVLGYFTLASGSIDISSLPESRREHLPDPIPTTLLARLAADRSVQGQGVGDLLMTSALRVAYEASQNVAAHLVVVEAKTDAVRRFYERYGFVSIEEDALRLYLEVKLISKLLR